MYLLGVLMIQNLKLCCILQIFLFSINYKNEAFGLALAEAMYYEKPAVTFTIPGSGVNYVCLDNENGIEVPNRDVRLMQTQLEKLAKIKIM